MNKLKNKKFFGVLLICALMFVGVSMKTNLNAANVLKWPLNGYTRVSSKYGYRVHPVTKTKVLHKGIDIPSRTGVPVRSAGAGIVTRTGYNRERGYYVKIKTNNFTHLYQHLQKGSIRVKKGQRVSKSQIIARVGNTGLATSSHLHFEVTRNGKLVNPLSYTSK